MFTSSLSEEASALGLAESLEDRLAASNAELKWETTFPKAPPGGEQMACFLLPMACWGFTTSSHAACFAACFTTVGGAMV